MRGPITSWDKKERVKAGKVYYMILQDLMVKDYIVVGELEEDSPFDDYCFSTGNYFAEKHFADVTCAILNDKKTDFFNDSKKRAWEVLNGHNTNQL